MVCVHVLYMHVMCLYVCMCMCDFSLSVSPDSSTFSPQEESDDEETIDMEESQARKASSFAS